jgi:hypothetical protein
MAKKLLAVAVVLMLAGCEAVERGVGSTVDGLRLMGYSSWLVPYIVWAVALFLLIGLPLLAIMAVNDHLDKRAGRFRVKGVDAKANEVDVVVDASDRKAAKMKAKAWGIQIRSITRA